MGTLPRWSAEDVKYLESTWGRVAIKTIARRLNRTVSAVRYKAIAMNLGGYLEDCGRISLNCLVKNFGYCKLSETLLKKLKNAGLPIKKRSTEERCFYMVEITDFWKWAEDHKDFFRFNELEPLILGKEPAWVDEQRRLDYKFKRKARRWTKAEDRLLEYLVSKGETCQSVSERLNRSERCIGTRCWILGIDVPRRVSKNKKWSAEEQQQLMELWHCRFPIKYIATQMHRSECSVKARIDLLLSKEAANG